MLLLLVKYSITYLYYSFYREMRLLNFVLYITTVASPASLVWRHCYTVIAYPAPVATATLICVQEMLLERLTMKAVESLQNCICSFLFSVTLLLGGP